MQYKTLSNNIYSFKKILSLAILISFLISCSKSSGVDNTGTGASTNVISAEVSILANDNKQTIQGFGCATVFAPTNTTALTTDEFDRLFGSGTNQVGLNILRIRVASDDSWRLTELGNAKAAIQRGAKILATPWSPPASMKTNNSINGGGSLKSDSSNAYAKYLNDFALYMNANGAPLYAISVQNEPDFVATYEGCEWTAFQMRDFLKNQGGLITATKLMAPELVNNNQTYISTIMSDAGAVANLKILGTHLYGGGIIENLDAKTKNIAVWMTEHLDTLTTYSANLNTAIEIHDCFTKANFSAYITWYGKRFYGPIGQDGQVTKRGYMISQFARFIKDGSVRMGTSTNSTSSVLVSAYKNGTKKVIVAINTGTVEVNQKFSFQDAITTVIPYLTTSVKNAEQGNAIALSNNSFVYSIPIGGVVTFVEQ
jgi:glucuronoarabinoxylan endo-1,4-beta-xylanase